MKILAYLETQDSRLKKSAFEAISAGRLLAGLSGGTLSGVMINAESDQLTLAGEYGLEDCFTVSNDALGKHSASGVAAVLAQVVDKNGFDIVLLPATSSSKEIAPRLAVKLQAGLVTDVVDFAIQDGTLIASKPVYAGKARVKAAIETAKKIFTIRPNIFTAKKAESSASTSANEFNAEIDNGDLKAQVQSVSRNTGKLDVAEAEIIVSGGRGLKGPENFYLVEELATAFGAAVGASRAVVDAGWRPHSEQVGQTGKTVSPNLYVACGISGAVQHLAGMSSSKIIVAINKDAQAPIFTIADYGIVGDVFEVLPPLTKLVAEATGNGK